MSMTVLGESAPILPRPTVTGTATLTSMAASLVRIGLLATGAMGGQF